MYMKLLTLFLGLLSCVPFRECTFIGWTTPASGSTRDYDAGDMYLNEGATTIITVAAILNPIHYAIVSQTTTDFFEIAAAYTGIVTLKGSNVLDGEAATLSHTIIISGDDVTGSTGTVTITFKILAGQFSYGYTCIYIGPTVPVSTTVTSNAMSSEGTDVITISSGNTNSDFSIVSATGQITAANTLTSSSGTSGSYTLVLKGVESIGTATTVTSTVYICLRESSCKCAISFSAADHITARLLGIFAAVIIFLL